MNWARLSVIFTSFFLVVLYGVSQSEAILTWPMAVQVGLQLTLALVVVAVIAQGAAWLVDAACRIAARLGVSRLVIGLTIVAFGTSAPEFTASLLAGRGGHGDLAVANVVGSNVFNLCFILGGVSLLLRSGLAAERDLVQRDGPVLLLGTLLLYVFIGPPPPWLAEAAQVPWGAPWPVPWNQALERWEGLCLLLGLATYLLGLYRARSRAGGEAGSDEAGSDAVAEEADPGPFRWSDVPLFLLGLGLVVGGCQMLVGEAEVVQGGIRGFGALWLAKAWGLPEYVVGVTIVAAGTSAPELVVSLVAALRGAFGLSAGNLIGSDICNFYGVLGLTGMLGEGPAALPVAISGEMALATLWPCAVVLVVCGFMRTQMRVSRLEGLCLVVLGMVRWASDLGLT